MTDLDTSPSSIRDDSICESSLHPNKSSGDIVERLRLNACRLSHESMDAFHMRRIRVELEAAAEIERLGREVVEARSLHRHQRDKRRHAHTARNKAIDGFEYWRARALIAESAVAASAWEEAEDAVRKCASLDENGYICEKSAAIKSIRASAIRAAVSKKTAESGHSPSTHNSESE